MQDMWVGLLDWEDTLEKETATHSSILAWEIPQTVEPGGLQSMEQQKVVHNLATKKQQIILALLFCLFSFPLPDEI